MSNKRHPVVRAALFVVLSVALVMVLQPAPTVKADDTGEFAGGYSYCKKIEVKASAVAGNETDFPAALILTDPALGQEGQCTGGRVKNVDPTGGVTGDIEVPADFVVRLAPHDLAYPLDHEIVNYNKTTGYIEMWVEIPSLSSSSNTPIFLCYGNSSVSESQEDITGTWNDFTGVWHLKEQNGVWLDEGDTVFNSAQGGGLTVDNTYGPRCEGGGKIGRALKFEEPYLETSPHPVLEGNAGTKDDSSFTLAAWVKSSAGDRRQSVMSAYTSYGGGDYFSIGLDGTADGNPAFVHCEDSYRVGEAYSTQGYGLDTWHYVVGTFKVEDELHKSMSVFLDGGNQGSTGDDVAALSDPKYANIGANLHVFEDENGTEGIIDEARIIQREVSPQWVSTSYMNQNSPSPNGNFWGIVSEVNAGDSTLYVDANATGANDGTSWADAYTDLQDALAAATWGDAVLVAKGVYTPGTTSSDSFGLSDLDDDVQIYGGFDPQSGADSWAERDWETNVTVLSGDIDGDDAVNPDGVTEHHSDIVGTNAAHVITPQNGNLSDLTVLNGFTVCGGDAGTGGGGGMYVVDELEMALTNFVFRGNAASKGGGLYVRPGNYDRVDLTLTNVTFSSNSASSDGGGAYLYATNYSSSIYSIGTKVTFKGNSAGGNGGGLWMHGDGRRIRPTWTNIVFHENSAANTGGGLYVRRGTSYSSVEATLTNATFYGNVAGAGGGAIYDTGGDEGYTRLANTIVWGNSPDGIQHNSSASFSVNYSNIQGGRNGTGNIDADPVFVDAANGDLRLRYSSPCIDSGTSSDAPSEDIEGTPRPQLGGYDMGAHELLSLPIFVDADATGANNGSSWADAYTDLQGALAVAQGGDEIWVAEGVYKPGTSSADTFTVGFNNLKMYGGFDPQSGDDSWGEREWVNNVTVLSGDVDNNDLVNADGVTEHYDDIVGTNSRVLHFQKPGGIISADTVLDGFTVCGGYSTGDGGGINVEASDVAGTTSTDYEETSPTLANLIIRGNKADVDGGGVNVDAHVENQLYNDGHAEVNPTLENILCVGNWAGDGGGGMAIHAAHENSSATIVNATFSTNHAEFWGGGLLVQDDDGGSEANGGLVDPTLTNVIVKGNEGAYPDYVNMNASPSLSHTNMTECALYTPIDTSAGNIDADPLFVDPDNGDFRVQPGSPSVDTGTASGAPIKDLDGKNRPLGSGYDMGAYEADPDTSPPTNPSRPADPQCAATDGTWQNTCANLNFVWAGASDGETGVAGYYVYWGTDPNGTAAGLQTAAAYDPAVVSSGDVYYLRVDTEDNAGNRAGWTTLFELRYDGTAPSNATTAIPDCGVSSGAWQNTCSDPTFTLSGASDGESSVSQYEVYWGTNASATSGDTQSGTTYAASAVSSGDVYYLRIRAQDEAGNWSDWVTLFEFKYDVTAPSNPTATPDCGVSSSAWQNTCSDPTFTLSGASDGESSVSQYEVYWGTNASATSGGTQSGTTYAASAVNSGDIYYLRVRTQDEAGNWSGWDTLFTLKYDATAPSNPTATPDCGVSSGVWQNTCSDPTFTLSGASDSESSVSQYEVYWGTNASATSGATQSGTTYAASAVSSGDAYYLRVRTQDEAGNWSDRATIFELRYDATAPSNPTATPDCGVSSGVWQNTCSDPTFTLSGASDGESSVSQYEVYWGTNASATSGATQSGTTYAVSAVSSGDVYYLRVRTQDEAGNWSVWDTLFTLKYDATAPSNVSSATPDCGVSSGVWQNTCNAPTFSLSGASDGESSVSQYEVYWGPDSEATSGITQAETTHSAAAVTSGNVYYLRIRTQDEAGNWSEWDTSFTLQYDATPPSNPTATPDCGVDNGVWQNTCSDPTFTLIGASDSESSVAGYDVYWGTDPGSVAGTYQTGATYDAVAVSSGGVYYLRVRTQDEAGNWSGWATLFEFKYDGTAPTNASMATEVSGASNGAWQNTCGDPAFMLWGASDSESGVAGYEVYWGPDSEATSGDGQSAATYDAAAVTSGDVYYLRVRTKDEAENWSDWATLFELKYDAIVPTNLSSATADCGVDSGVWQNTCSDPVFALSGASDGESDVAGYEIYWGIDPGATSGSYQTGTDYDATSVNGGDVHYLRVKTRDEAGNWSDWATLFEFKYDGTPPNNTTTATPDCGVTSGVWQSTCSDPAFTLSGASDGESDVAEYEIYWGPDPDATLGTIQTETVYDAASVTNGDVYYLRVRLMDAAGNWSGWATVFEFKYDGTAPTNPVATADCGVDSGVWQNTCSDPTFTLSGASDAESDIAGYEVYWGPDSEATSGITQTETNYTAMAVSSGDVYYLRVRTQDEAGNWSGWDTLFELRYDATAPSNPTATPDCGVSSGTWQNTCSDPTFTLSGASDGESSVTGYGVYWGTNASATSGDTQTNTTYDAPTVGSGEIHYLRVRTQDEAGNWSDWATIFELRYEDTAPANPSRPADAQCSAVDGVWQNTCSDPDFVWSGASDEGSGVAGYYVYWGSESSGTDTTFTTAAAYNPDPVNSGTYYLRVDTEDNLGHRAGWTTLFEFKYDSASPTNPSAVDIDAACAATDGVWQNACSDPAFTWSGASDDESGVAGYYVYWGPSSSGISVDLQAIAALDPDPVPDGTYYLRVNTEDNQGNEAGWTTLFEFKYDGTTPINPDRPAEPNVECVAVDGEWQDTCNDPDFTWSGASDDTSGVAGYYIYWGHDADGTSDTFTSAPAAYPEPLTGGTYFLRVDTEDEAGNRAGWKTIFEFKYDDSFPSTPTRPANPGCSVVDSVWQDDCNDPDFTWSGASDEHSGVGGYYIYWGTEPDGTSTTYTTAAAYDPDPVASGTYYLRVDTEDNLGHRTGWRTLFEFKYDATPPTTPVRPADPQCLATDGAWQNSCGDPDFTWSGAVDEHSGIAGYYVYLGTDPDGVSTAFTTTAAYDPEPVSSGTYYLRIDTEDSLGHRAGWATLFEFKYDDTPPTNPVRPAEAGCAAADGVWQNACDDPSFTWSDGGDDHSGVAGYYVYWGTEPGGVSTAFTTTAAYGPEPVSSGTYYLRVDTADNLGHRAGWATLFEFKYDNTPPTNPARPADAGCAATDGVWQDACDDPSFTWADGDDDHSGVAGYYVYWGTELDGTSAIYTTTTAYDPDPVSSGTYYLRVDTEDSLGNRAGWITLFEFKYDETLPTNPVRPADPHCSATDGGWQDSCADPSFTWTRASDEHSGVDGYYVYWGTDPNGITTTYTTTATYDPDTVASGSTYYLRVDTADGLGHRAGWVTLFEFKYDDSAPSNPDRPADIGVGCDATDGVWQNSCNDPDFTWSEVEDDGGGVVGYYVYWGTDPSGVSTTLTTTAAYDPDPVSSGTYYLRVDTEDTLGHRAGWVTLFEFKYDDTDPANPDRPAEPNVECVVTDGVWQDTCNDPDFTWSGASDEHSGVDGYYIYWGPNAEGTSDIFTSAPAAYPEPVTGGTYYLRVDTEDEAGNRAGWKTVFEFKYDDVFPNTPVRPANPGCSATDGVWQGDCNDPDFTWSGASDDHSGVAGYYVYWGTEPDGTSTTFTTTAAHDPDPVASGTYYLRVDTEDNLGHRTGWMTLFEFKYDGDSPANPGRPADPGVGCAASDAVWQSACDAPDFTWSGASDDHSGVAGYYVYWGTDPNGVSTTYTTTAGYAPAFVGSGTYYLRVDTADGLGHRAGWTTLFEFKYDNTTPVNPDRPASVGVGCDAADGVWQGSCADPSFTWSGASDEHSGVGGYYVYWGTDPNGITTTYTTTAAYDPDAVASGSTHYLRVDTADGVGHRAGWVTLFEFKYDDSAPSNPDRPADPGVGCDAVDGVWQNSCSDPDFTWSDVEDDGGGVAGYYVYWGTDPSGVSTTLTTTAAYDPAPVSSGTYYLRVDTEDTLGHRAGWKTLFEFKYDDTLPSNPARPAGSGCSAADGIWQNVCDDPSFTWSDGGDEHSGVAGYYVYFGPDADGTSTTYTTAAAHNPDPVLSGTYYLRVDTEDDLGQRAGWTTLFEFKYDDTPPTNPVRPAEAGCGATDGVWQNACDDPSFTWSDGGDEHSGVAGYYVYWGTDADGTRAIYTTTTAYDPDPVSSGTYYLRVDTEDTLGQRAGWTTLFEFKYDGTSPISPVRPADPQCAATDGVWQNTCNDPSFTWSGASDGHSDVAGYYVYWGTDPDGISTTFTTTAAYTPEPVTSGTYYLRVDTEDDLGQRSGWTTLFEFKYDGSLPVSPESPADPQCLATDGVWQDTCDDPSFTWSGASDEHSGLAGYYVYWGPDADGVSTTFTTTAGYAPGVVFDGTYYLRVDTEDNLGHRAGWTTLFEFKYDDSSPTNPDRPADPGATCSATDGVWRADCGDPDFTWTGASDPHSGIAGYYVYWGTNPDGTSATFTTTAAHNPGLVDSGSTHYLRVDTEDNLGHRSGWTTLFEFKFDDSAPGSPDRPADPGTACSATDGIWQNACNDPDFTWIAPDDSASGIAGYYVYWGIEPDGTSTTFATSTAYNPDPVTEGTYYLRVDTEDNLGHRSGWKTLFEFKYDGTAPANPDRPADPQCSATDDVWQNTCDDPSFTWSGAGDEESSVAGYYAYWGPEADGTSTDFQTAPDYDPVPVSNGTYYLRVDTEDEAGNRAGWATLFTLKYDGTAPTNPDRPASSGCSVADGVWQDTCAAPSFTWSGAGGGESGMAGYYVYWGQDADGTSTDFQISPAHIPDAVSSGTYYLRVDTEDGAGNRAGWKTLFELKYDGSVPDSPYRPADPQCAATDGVWQSACNNPDFIWAGAGDPHSGLAGYYVYWGPDADGTSMDFQASAAYNPDLVSDGTYYLRVDAEDNLGHRAGWTTIYEFKYDGSAPTSPARPADPQCAATDGVWQNTCDDPDFTWAGAVDGHSGVAGYYVYWGTDPNGISTTLTTTAAYDPEPVTSGTYYLRVDTEDNLGQRSGWTTLFEFKYDGSPPTNPASPADLDPSCSAAAGVWQDACDDPAFTWSGASDDHSGVAGYYVYWGADADGVSTTFTTTAGYAPGVVSDGTYYLRVDTEDNLGHRAGWTTLFEFKYDGSSPTNPDRPADPGATCSATDGVWQPDCDDPDFTWAGASDPHSGIAGYYVYWGTNPDGTSATFTTTAAYNPGPVNSGRTHYLRVDTEDALGHRSGWTTLFEFKFDDFAPGSPDRPADPGTACSATDGIWQNACNDPDFTWIAPDDSASGIAGYYVYWGSEPNGTSTTFTTTTAYDPDPVTEGTYYLRVDTEDNLGHRTGWKTLFEFKYDDTAPTNPDRPASPQCSATDSVWQNTCDDPGFTWSGASDAHSDIAGYYVYFGPDADGVGDTFTSIAGYAPSPLSDGTYYLRVDTEDAAGNRAGWTTLFEFKYDSVAPNVASTANPGVECDAESGVWQSICNDPIFTWAAASDADSGVAGYYVYWGTAPDGTSDTVTTTAAYDPDPVANGAHYLRVDTEDNAGNRTGWTTLYTLNYDATPPTNPAATPDCGATSGVWQNTCDDPTFTLSGAGDGESSVAAYEVYWGPNASATSGITQAGTTYDAASVSSGDVYYLRVRTQDEAGNWSGWETLFELRYDVTAPSNPSRPADPQCVASDGVWQGTCADPSFTWAGADDGESSVAGYYVYWGADLDGTSTDFQAGAAYDPGPVATGTYYLRVRTEDEAGNRAGWTTLFELRYDDVPPTNPTSVDPQCSATDGEWQNTCGNPNFTWSGAADGESGVEGYEVYWGTESDATSGSYQTSASYDPDAVGSGDTYYLRIRTRDEAGNWSGWDTMFTLKYDGTSPNNPTATPDCGVTSGAWQNTCSAPTFTLSGARDGESSVSQYEVYWGTNASATSGATQSGTTYPASAVSSGAVHHLRVRTQDEAGNWSGWATLFTLKYDATPPSNPTATPDCGVTSGAWQNTCNAPTFTLSGASDGESSVSQYEVYWGTSSTATWGATQSGTTYDAAAISSGDVYYLRVRTQDEAGNWSGWDTLFELKYDATAPTNTTTATPDCGVSSGAWQNTCNAPTFTLSGASDGESSVSQYEVYWGTNASATSGATQTSTTYAASAVSSGAVYYLRIRTRDEAGNWSGWDTLFTLKYDTTAPTNPTSVDPQCAATNGAWQNTCSDPDFTWSDASDGESGVEGYEVYWGTETEATSGSYQTSTGYDPGAVSSDVIHYLRLRTLDEAGNWSAWVTLFELRYDGTPPSNPATVDSRCGASSGVWQNICSDPSFTWSGASDPRGIAGYHVYWGPDADGTTTYFQAEASYHPAPLSTGAILYLRVQTQDNVGNWSDWVTLFELRYDTAAPTNPARPADPQCEAVDGEWQNTCSDPDFTWSGAMDAESGAAGYEVYWGTNADGTSTDYQAAPSYNPEAVSSGEIHYLRVRTEDAAGNWSDWTTLFEFKYDGTPPSSPSSVDPQCAASDGVWQDACDDPNFTWSGASDSASGVAGYYVYWGPASDGMSETLTATPAHDPDVVTSGIYYLRVNTEDAAGNRTGWETLFEFRYDDTAPANPTSADPGCLVLDGFWQNMCDDPDFTWEGANDDHSGIAGYYVYWGSDPEGTSADLQAMPAYDPESVSDGTYYLRVDTEDRLGHRAGWTTLFEFKYDGSSPTSPDRPADPQCEAADGGWTNCDPRFTWACASDDTSGVAGYYVYWGTDSDATGDIFTTEAAHDPAPEGSGTYYLRVDAQDNAGNRTGWTTLFELKYDGAAPANPSRPADPQCSAKDGVWQGDCNDPNFTWSGASDEESGVGGYYVYWGSNANGASVNFQAEASYDPGPVGTGTYYLRVDTEDLAGNRAGWETIFVLRYDETSPMQPSRPADPQCEANDGVWQNTCSDPTFTWSAPSDDASDVAGYYVYWGTDPDGTGETFTTAPAHDPDAVTSGAYYLRVDTEDNSGHRAGWKTLFAFKYDATSPANPNRPADSGCTAADGAWQGTCSNPAFTWAGAGDAHSGLDGYFVYWGTDPDGTGSAFTGADGYTPSALTDSGTYYLRTQARDYAGHLAPWATVFAFCYDSDAPAVTITAPLTVTNAAPFAVEWNSTDATSGVEVCTVGYESLDDAGVLIEAGGSSGSVDVDPAQHIVITVTAVCTDVVGHAGQDVARTEVTGDLDGDGMPDSWEVANALDPTRDDSDDDPDFDGLVNIGEFIEGTDPHDEDTDGDGVIDGDEVSIGTEPLNPDTDGDGWTDGEEVNAGTDPLDPLTDMDGDGMPDRWERDHGLDPTDPDDGSDDRDGDGLTNALEYAWGTDPNNPDTDGNGWTDGEEVREGSDPTDPACVPAPKYIFLPMVVRGYQTPARPHELDDAPDNCPGEPVVIGHHYIDDFDRENDNDFYAFEAQQGETYVIQTSGLGMRADTILTLLEQDCSTVLAENDDVSWPSDLSSRITWEAPTAGTFCARVRSHDYQVYGLDTSYTFGVSRGESTEMQVGIHGMSEKPAPPPTPSSPVEEGVGE